MVHLINFYHSRLVSLKEQHEKPANASTNWPWLSTRDVWENYQVF